MFNSSRRPLLRVLAATSLAIASGCATDGFPPPSAQSYSAGQSGEPPGEFRLGSGDKVRLKVFGADQISGEYEVDLSGGLAVPLAGTIPAIGLTPLELGDRVAAKLREQRMVDNPRVSVEVISTRPFYILGEVEKPGEYPFHAGLNIINAVAIAGGFRYRADQSYVLVRHGGKDEEIRIPFALAAPILPGDIIRVPARHF
jgi:protein involved in polysaccharide export with SLBB domain